MNFSETSMRSTLWIVLALAASIAIAQIPRPKDRQDETSSSGFTLRSNARLVVIDVAVQDSQGRPVRGLRASDFQLSENRQPQKVKSFEEHSGNTTAQLQQLPKLPAGTFTNYTHVAPDSTLNVILIDALNTPTTDQAYVRKQLQEYIKRAPPQSRIAIFGLTNHLILLQGFTSDPAVLKDAVEHRLTPRTSALLADPNGANTDTVSSADMMSDAGVNATAVAAMRQFDAEQTSFQTQLRIQYTLNAFSQLARYLANFPNRKNLIWFSGSFPISIFGDIGGVNTFAAQADFSDQIRETTSLLQRARVAVYPVDARGLQATPVFDASRGGAGFAAHPSRPAAEIGRFGENNAAEHATMDKIAEDTGGRAFFNTNDLAEAVAQAVNSGTNYYTLSYTPTNAAQNSEYRSIQVNLNETLASRGWKLTYRRGYFASEDKSGRDSNSVLAMPSPSSIDNAGYGQLAMEHGAPTPSEIIFKASVLPASDAVEDAVAPQNVLDPAHPVKGPFRRYQVSCTALSRDFELPSGADGLRHGSIEFVTYVYDHEGKLIDIVGQTFRLDLGADTYARLLKTGMSAVLQVSAPAKGEAFFRIAVHDKVSGHFGVIEIPDTAVSGVAPVASLLSSKK